MRISVTGVNGRQLNFTHITMFSVQFCVVRPDSIMDHNSRRWTISHPKLCWQTAGIELFAVQSIWSIWNQINMSQKCGFIPPEFLCSAILIYSGKGRCTIYNFFIIFLFLKASLIWKYCDRQMVETKIFPFNSMILCESQKVAVFYRYTRSAYCWKQRRR